MTVKKVKGRGRKHYVRRHYVKKQRFDPNFDPEDHGDMGVVTYKNLSIGGFAVNAFFSLIMFVVTFCVISFVVGWVI